MKYIFLIFFSCVVGLCFTQSTSTIFKPISLDQGHINDIMRDSEGFLWISTQDGLSKYNGTHFIQYNYDRKDSNSIAHNYVWRTFEDNRNNIWIGLFGGGLCRFDKKENLFFRYDKFETIAKHGIRTFDQLNDSTLIVGTDYGLYLFNLNSNSFIQDSTFLKNQFDSGLYHSHSIEVIGGDILVAGENGAYILVPSSKLVKKINNFNLGLDKIRFVRKLEAEKYLLSDRFNFLEAKYDSIEKRFFVERGINSEASITINDLSQDKLGEILLVAEEGLFKLNFDKQSIIPISNKSPEKNNLKDKVAYCVETIEPNLIWIGTKTHIYEFSEKKNPFYPILSSNLCGSAILGMTEDKKGNLWVATRRGLGRIKNFNNSISEWEYVCYDKSTNPEMRNEYVLNIKVIDDDILVGFRKKGFSSLKLENGNKISFHDPPKEVDKLTNSASVSNFLYDNDKNLWISTSGNGVIKWRYHSTDDIHQYLNIDGLPKVLSHNYTFGFEELDENWLAVATAAGISIIGKDIDSTYQIYNGKDSLSLSGNFIMDFHRDSKDQLWVCTDGGINLWKENNSFKSWTKNEGLPNDNIYGMLEFGNELWVSTNRGLVRFQNNNEPTFKIYSVEDDVLNEEHNQFSFYKSIDNKLLFGGKNGITYFDPNDIKPNTIEATPVIESFSLFNKSGTSKLKHHINYTDELILNHNENFLSFDIAALSYFKSNQNLYRYRLDPLNEDWIVMGKRNFFSLNGLAPGQYTLSIQSSNNDGVWGKATKTLNITIKRPIYTRWYAWLFYASIFFGIVYTYYKMKIDHITNLNKVREDERTKIRERSARDFHDEVGALVTKLSLLNQYALSNTAKDNEENIGVLNKMQSNIQRIRTGMKDFIWVLDPSKDSLQSTIIKIREIGNDLFEHSGIKYVCNIDQTVDKSSELNGAQRRQLILLLKEVLNNVAKHSNSSKCSLEINQTDQHLYFIVTDNGVGFDTSVQFEGYGLKSMKERARKLGGELSIKSSEEKGTQTTIRIPNHPNGL